MDAASISMETVRTSDLQVAEVLMLVDFKDWVQ